MTPTSLLPVAQVAASVANDPQFQLPARPRLASGIVAIPLPDGLILDGGPARQVLRGRSAMSIVPRVIDLLDGTRTAAEVDDLLPDLPDGTTAKVIAVLYHAGTLDGGPPPDGDPPGSGATYLGRLMDSTRVWTRSGDLRSRMRHARPVIVGDGESAARVVDLLIAAGLPGTVLADPADLSRMRPGTDIVAAVAERNLAWLDAVDDWARSNGATWLRVVIGAGGLDVGPLFGPGLLTCARCAVEGSDRPDGPTTNVRAAATRTVLEGLAAHEIMALTVRVGAPLRTQRIRRYRASPWQSSDLSVVSSPDCACQAQDASSPAHAMARQIEELVALPPQAHSHPKDHQQHYELTNLRLQSGHKTYRSAPRVPAPTLPSSLRTDLETMIERSVGLRRNERSSSVTRWAPTAGNLGSAHCYVLALQTEGLERGWCTWDVERGELRSLPVPEPPQGWEALLGAPPGTGAVLVLTGTADRMMHKYKLLGIRLMLQDAGVAASHLAMVGASLGHVVAISPWWDALTLAELLGLDPQTEPVTAVVGVRWTREGDACPSSTA